MKIVAVYDQAIEAFGRPIFVRSLGEAERSFRDEINNADSPMYKHPEDYSLYSLGTFNEDTGTIDGLEKPQRILTGNNAKQPTED